MNTFTENLIHQSNKQTNKLLIPLKLKNDYELNISSNNAVQIHDYFIPSF